MNRSGFASISIGLKFCIIVLELAVPTSAYSSFEFRAAKVDRVIARAGRTFASNSQFCGEVDERNRAGGVGATTPTEGCTDARHASSGSTNTMATGGQASFSITVDPAVYQAQRPSVGFSSTGYTEFDIVGNATVVEFSLSGNAGGRGNFSWSCNGRLGPASQTGTIESWGVGGSCCSSPRESDGGILLLSPGAYRFTFQCSASGGGRSVFQGEALDSADFGGGASYSIAPAQQQPTRTSTGTPQATATPTTTMTATASPTPSKTKHLLYLVFEEADVEIHQQRFKKPEFERGEPARNKITTKVQSIFKDYGVQVTRDKPDSGSYSTIWVGGSHRSIPNSEPFLPTIVRHLLHWKLQ